MGDPESAAEAVSVPERPPVPAAVVVVEVYPAGPGRAVLQVRPTGAHPLSVHEQSEVLAAAAEGVQRWGPRFLAEVNAGVPTGLGPPARGLGPPSG